jgi:hypothetical protein
MLIVRSLPASSTSMIGPNGTIMNVRNAGTSVMIGARMNITRSALAGIRSSLRSSLMPSTIV